MMQEEYREKRTCKNSVREGKKEGRKGEGVRKELKGILAEKREWRERDVLKEIGYEKLRKRGMKRK